MTSKDLDSGTRRHPGTRVLGPLTDVRTRRLAWQAITLLCFLGAAYWLVSNLRTNLAVRDITSGFGFLNGEAGIPIAEHLISYDTTDTYARALLIGTLNTLWVAFWGIIIATILGTSIGVARLSRNWLLSRLAGAYVEFFRDIPLLLQLLFWYTVFQALPSVRQAFEPVPGVILSNRGLNFPTLKWQAAHSITLGALIFGVLATVLIARVLTRRNLEDGRNRRLWPTAAGLILGLPVFTIAVFKPDFAFDIPKLGGFNVRGGGTISPEFTALLLGLVVYNAAFIAEIVRSGLQSVSHGQHEAAQALGLKPKSALKWIVFPQALRVIIPPMTSQYLNLTKNSSLAVAIGYQDLVSIANTAMNQGGHAVEIVGIIMAVYLTISLSISLLMNLYNSRMALVER